MAARRADRARPRIRTSNLVIVIALTAAAIAAIFSTDIQQMVSQVGSPPIVHDESGRPWFRLSSKDDAKQRQIEACFALGERQTIRDADDRFCCAQKEHRWCDMPAGVDKGFDGGTQ